MSGEVKFTATIDDWVIANVLWYRHTKGRRILMWLGVAAALLFASVTSYNIFIMRRCFPCAVGSMLPVLIFAVLVLVILASSRYTIRWHMRRQFAQRPSMAEPVQFRWSADAIHATARTGTTDQPWTELHRQLRDAHSFVFLLTDQMMLLIPRRVLTAEQAIDLAETADRYGPPIR